ncbi:MAG: Gfo/Idh/MocA family oxidoreductase [Chloroflexi bacterium]|nr:Gfo/Idh/MocA family oxidoreductase [Chloroflexota bacterium]
MTARLRLGLIGAGAWAIAAHLPAFARRPDVEPLIVSRRDPELLERVRSDFGFARASTDWREVIAARPDIVAITGSVALRAEQVKAALEAGAHVLCEKPFTVSPADAWALARLARTRDRHLMLCYAWNEMGIVERARQLLLEDGGVGEVEHVALEMATVVRELLRHGATYLPPDGFSPPRAETWADPAVSGGGYGQGQLTHGIGLLFRIVGLRATDVGAFTAAPGGASVELHDAIAVRFDGGAIGTIGGASTPPGTFGSQHQLTLRITGSRGVLGLDLGAERVRRSRGAADDTVLELTAEDVRWSFDRVVDRFVDLATGRTDENRSPGELGARVVEVLDATYRSAESGRIVAIDRSLGV